MLLSKKRYIADMIDGLVGGRNLTGIRDIVDDCIETYIDSYTTAVANNWNDSSPESCAENAIAVKLEEMILASFGKDMLHYIHNSTQYKEMLAEKQAR